MPVFDFLAFGRIVVRYGIVVGIVLYVGGLVNTIADGVTNLWNFISGSIDKLSNVFDGTSSSLSCAFAMMSAMGIDIALSSFLLTAMGLLTLWSSIVLHFMIIRLTMLIKGYYLEGSK